MQEVGLRMRERLRQMVLEAQDPDFKALPPRTIVRSTRTLSPTRVSITEPVLDVNPASPPQMKVCVCVFMSMRVCVCVCLEQ